MTNTRPRSAAPRHPLVISSGAPGLIGPMRHCDKALEQNRIRTAEPVWADIVVSHQNVTALGRYQLLIAPHLSPDARVIDDL